MVDEADSILTHDMIAERALFDLKNELTFSKNVYKGYTSEFHSVGGYQKGNTVRIHLPNKYRVQDGAAIKLVGTRETSTTVVVDKHKHVALDFTSEQLTLDIADFSRKYIQPAVNALANFVDLEGCKEVLNLYNHVGTPGTTPSTFGVLADAALRMDNEAVPRTERVSVLSPKSHWTMASGDLKSVFQPQMVETLIRRGFIGRFALMDFYMDQNMQNHKSGTVQSELTGGVAQVKTKPAEGATVIDLKGMTNGRIITKGTVFTIAGVVGVNPVSGEAWEGDELRQFVATADQTVDVSTDLNALPVSPPFISDAADDNLLPYQTIVDMPEINDNIEAVHTDDEASYVQNVCYHPDCFALTMVPFQKPKSAGQAVMWSTASDDQMGLSITFSSGYDIKEFTEIYRLDILYGWDTIRAELGVRITG